MKLFETSVDIKESIEKVWENTSLPQMGINLEIISTSKAKQILKVQRANATTNFLTKNDIIITVFEEAFDRLSDDFKYKLVEGCLSSVSYDTEKDKLLVETDIAKEIFRMRRHYENYVDIMEASYAVIEQIEDEEKRRKEEEKLKKAEEKAAKKRN